MARFAELDFRGLDFAGFDLAILFLDGERRAFYPAAVIVT
jgi:hypothetical protein